MNANLAQINHSPRFWHLADSVSTEIGPNRAGAENAAMPGRSFCGIPCAKLVLTPLEISHQLTS